MDASNPDEQPMPEVTDPSETKPQKAGRNNNRRPRQRRRQPKEERKPKDNRRELHVSGESPVKKVAGAIAWIAREGECPRILATQPPAINTACKAIAIARTFLQKDKMDIMAYPRFSNPSRRAEDSFTFELSKTSLTVNNQSRKRFKTEESPAEEVVQEMKISKNSKLPTVAGAISARVCEGQRVALACIDRDCVSVAIRSIAIARSYLAEDSVDISFRPCFKDISFQDGRTSSSLQFHILAQQV